MRGLLLLQHRELRSKKWKNGANTEASWNTIESAKKRFNECARGASARVGAAAMRDPAVKEEDVAGGALDGTESPGRKIVMAQGSSGMVMMMR